MTGLVAIIVWLLILGIVIALVYYVADAIPLPAPINRIVKIAATVIACLIILMLLLQMVGVSTGVNLPSID